MCNAEVFGQGDDSSSDRGQQKQDLAKLQELLVCDWLRSLSFRIPTKCDLAAGGMVPNLAERIDCAIRKWLDSWRGSGMTAVHVENGVSLASCVASSAAEGERGAALGKKEPEASM